MKFFSATLLSAVLILAGAGCNAVNQEVLIKNEPMITADVWPLTPQPNTPSANITVETPLSYSHITGNTVEVSGTARVFENQLNWELRTDTTVLFSGLAMADAPDIGQFGPYTFEIDVSSIPADTILTLEVFDYSAKDGTKENRVIVPLLR